MFLSVATYNIHRGVGRDGRRDITRIADVIREIDPDVIGLQEVESSSQGELRDHQLNYLAAELGLHAIAGPTIFKPDAEYGNALLTRLPVLQTRRLDLSFVGREPRGALDVDLKAGNIPVRVVITHFGLRLGERRKQLQQLLHALSFNIRPLTMLLVDMNEWVPWSSLVHRLHKELGHAPASLTFPSKFPLLPLDRIWVSPTNALTAIEAHRTALARLASDHLPLRAKVDLRDALIHEK